MTCWHHETAAAVLSELHTRKGAGLTEEEVGERLARHGPNELESPPGRSMFLRFLDQLRDPMILVLLAAALLSVAAGGDWVDGAIILVIIVVNAVISIVQEQNAEKALEALSKLSAPKAKVIRSGRTEEVDASLLVPGDIVLLEAGDRCPPMPGCWTAWP